MTGCNYIDIGKANREETPLALDATLRKSLALPAFCAPMTLVSGPDLVREAAKAGVMAGIPRHNARSREEFEAWLKAIRADLDRFADEHPDAPVGPLAVNLAGSLPLDETMAELEMFARYGVKVIVSALGEPTELARRVHDWGGLIYHDVTSMKFAEKAIRAGVDGLTCIGSGGGGHSGLINLMTLIPRIRAIFDGTIVMAGAVTTGAAIRAAEVLGADLAYLGTRFIATRESMAPQAYKDLIVDGAATDLIYTPKVAGAAANWLKGSLVRSGLDPEDLPASRGHRNYDHLPADVRPWRDIWSAGQGIELIHDIPTVAELVDRLKAEYAVACAVPPFGATL